ncbi:MAG: alpha/beta hydrolase, partial [Bacilli bacterium]|nr:alpha/beta hydrolase [Bacilli bacterium]
KLIENYKEVVVIANSIGAFYAYEYLSDFNIKKAFFISPIADMGQIIFNLMMQNHISRDELKQKKEIKLENGQTLSYDFYVHTLNYKDNWNVPTEILYGSKDEIVYIENITDFLTNHPNARLTIMQGAGHYFHTKKEKNFIKNWILQCL